MAKKKSAKADVAPSTFAAITNAESLSNFGGAKHTIRQIVEGYKLLYPEEYEAVCQLVREKRAALADDKFATAGKGSYQRGLFELPALVHDSIVELLTDDQLLWFKTGTKINPNEGGRWFAKTFPEFRIADQI